MVDSYYQLQMTALLRYGILDKAIFSTLSTVMKVLQQVLISVRVETFSQVQVLIVSLWSGNLTLVIKIKNSSKI